RPRRPPPVLPFDHRGSCRMIKLEQLQPGAAVRGIVPDAMVVVVSVQWFGSDALELTYKTPSGKVSNELLYRHDEPRLDLVEQGRPWGFDGDGSLFRLVSEAQRIRLAHRPPVPGDQPGHRPPRQALAQRGRPAEAPGARRPLGPRGLRRGAQDVGHGVRRRDQVHQALPARAAPLDPDAALPADDGDP